MAAAMDGVIVARPGAGHLPVSVVGQPRLGRGLAFQVPCGGLLLCGEHCSLLLPVALRLDVCRVAGLTQADVDWRLGACAKTVLIRPSGAYSTDGE